MKRDNTLWGHGLFKRRSMSENPLQELVDKVKRFQSIEQARNYLMVIVRGVQADLESTERAISALAGAFRLHCEQLGKDRRIVRCSFCHRTESECGHMVAATFAAICEDCANIALDSIEERLSKDVKTE